VAYEKSGLDAPFEVGIILPPLEEFLKLLKFES
jgi:hypothetical protein